MGPRFAVLSDQAEGIRSTGRLPCRARAAMIPGRVRRGGLVSERLTVLGGGPGGYAAAFLAADLGLAVTMIDEAPNPGGVCLYRGCIPSKALLHVAKVISDAQEASAWGVRFTKPKIDLEKVRDWKESVVGRMTGGLGSLAKQRNVTLLQGRGRFISSSEITVATDDGAEQRVGFDHAIIASGSRPAMVPALTLNSARVMNSTSALELPDIPKRLLVVGGGYIGLELGSAYAALGSAVTVVEMTGGLLPGVDRDLVGILERRLRGSLDAICVGTRVDSVEETEKGLSVTLSGAESRTERYDRMLISIGRVPNTEDLGLEHTGAVVGADGFIKHDEQQRTSDPAIFAVGDVAGQPMLAHKASHEGCVAAEVAAGKRVAFEPQAIPAVVFTDPEIAWCGLTETDAKATGHDAEVASFPWGASGRASTLGRSEGLTKLLIDPGNERVLGCGIAGPGAGELIAEAVLAIEMGAVATDVRLTIHPHPTLSETLMEASEVLLGTATHIFRPRR